LDKPYAILRPKVLPDTFDSVLLKHAEFITSYAQFKVDYFKDDTSRRTAIDDYHIDQYYQIDTQTPSFVKYVDFLERLYKSKKQNFSLSIGNKIIAKMKTLFAKLMYTLYRYQNIDLDKYRTNSSLKRNFFIEWFIEMDNQIVSNDEKRELEDKLKEILQKKQLNNG